GDEDAGLLDGLACHARLPGHRDRRDSRGARAVRDLHGTRCSRRVRTLRPAVLALPLRHHAALVTLASTARLRRSPGAGGRRVPPGTTWLGGRIDIARLDSIDGLAHGPVRPRRPEGNGSSEAPGARPRPAAPQAWWSGSYHARASWGADRALGRSDRRAMRVLIYPRSRSSLSMRLLAHLFIYFGIGAILLLSGPSGRGRARIWRS